MSTNTEIETDAENVMTLALAPEQDQAIKDASLVRWAAKYFRDQMDFYNSVNSRTTARCCYGLSNRLHELANRLEERAGIPMDEHDSSGGA